MVFEPNTTDFDKSVVVEMDLNVWNLSFGGIFLIKIGLGFLFQATETLFMSGFCHTFVAFWQGFCRRAVFDKNIQSF